MSTLSPQSPVRVSRHLIELRRGERMILMHGMEPRMLVLGEGKEFVLSLLEAVRSGSAPTLADLRQLDQGTGLGGALAGHGLLRAAADPEIYDVPADAPLHTAQQVVRLTLMPTPRAFAEGVGTAHPESALQSGKSSVASQAIRRLSRGLPKGGRLEVFVPVGDSPQNLGVPRAVVAEVERWCRGRRAGPHVRYVVYGQASTLPPDDRAWLERNRVGLCVDLREQDVAEHLSEVIPDMPGLRVRLAVNGGNVSAMVPFARAAGERASLFFPVHGICPGGTGTPNHGCPDPAAYADQLWAAASAREHGWESVWPLSALVSRLRNDGACWPCQMPFGNTPSVDARGNVYLCPALAGDDSFKLGHLSDPGVRFSRSYLLYELVHRLHVDNLPRCRQCRWRYLCGGPCPALSLREIEGDGHAGHHADTHCAAIGLLLERLTWEIAERTAGPMTAPTDAPTIQHVHSDGNQRP